MIDTPRLILRRWRNEDIEPFVAMNSKTGVDAWLDSEQLDRDQATVQLANAEAHFEAHGFGPWAIERRADGALIAMCGLRHVDGPDHPMAPCIEISCRQSRSAWGQGYATEAAGAALMDGFLRRGLERVDGFAAADNVRSQRVMIRIGMHRTPARDFDAPAFPRDHKRRPHHAFAINSRRWMEHLATCARSA